MHSRRWTGLRALVAVTLAALTTVSCAGATTSPGAPPSAAAPRPLRILLANDDGWFAPGIVALREALERAGNTVVEVAPATDQSGTGAAMTLTSPLTLSRPTPAPNIWAVTGRPADAVSVGVRHLMTAAPPDLMISGINSGNNVTTSLLHSGTIGAATTAAELGIPAMAVSGPQAPAGDRDPGQYAAAADFTARLVTELSTHPPGQKLLHPGMVLNVNYPRVPPGARAQAVLAAPPAQQQGLVISYSTDVSGQLTPQLAIANPLGGDDDASAVSRGEVALSDLAVTPVAPSPTFGVSAGLAGRLRP